MESFKCFAADDWGLSPGINAGILELAKRRRLHSVSCVANSRYLEHGLTDLLKFRDEIDFSIHINLTYGKPLSPKNHVSSLTDTSGGFFSHRSLLFRSAAGLVKTEHVLTEVTAQFERLRQLHIPLTSFNGHHHIHLWPPLFTKMRAALLAHGVRKMRMMNDPEHPWSFCQSRLFSTFIESKEFSIEKCGYLTRKNRSKPQKIEKKLMISDAPLLVHPALYNDFAKSKMFDTLQEERINELTAILEYLDGTSEQR